MCAGKIAGLLVAGLIAGCSPAGGVPVRLGDICLIVPQTYLSADGLVPQFDKLAVDLSTPELAVVVPYNELAPVIGRPGGEVAVGTRPGTELRVIISVLSARDLKYIHSGIHDADLWRGTGQYSEGELGRRIEWDPQSRLYKIYYAEIPRGWTFTDLDPRTVKDQLPSSDHVVGACRETGVDPSQDYSCIHSAVLSGVAIQYWASSPEVANYRAIDGYLFSKVSSWREAGAAPQSPCVH